MVKNEGEHIQIKIYDYGVTQAGAPGGGNIEKFRQLLNRENHENHEKLAKKGFFLTLFGIISRRNAAQPRYSVFQNLEVFPHPKIPKSVGAHRLKLCSTRLKKL